MPRIKADVATKLETHQKIALGFIVGTALMVLVSVILAGTGTLTAKRTNLISSPSDRTFQTAP